MSNQVFPIDKLRGLDIRILRRPSFGTLKQSSPNRYETRLAQQQNPYWKWQIAYNWLYNDPANIASGLTYTDYQTLLGFFMSRLGMFDDYLLKDPDDHTVGPGLISASPNQAARLALVNNAGTYYTPLQRPMGGLTSTWNDASRFFEDVTDIDSSGLQIYANGVAKTGGGVDYTIVNGSLASGVYSMNAAGLSIPGAAYMGLYLGWTAPPTPPITAQFTFYFRIKFSGDEEDFERFMNQLYTMGEHSSRGNAYLEVETARPVFT